MEHAIIEYLAAVTIKDQRLRSSILPRVVADDVVYSHVHAPGVCTGLEQLKSLLEGFDTHKPTTTWEPIGPLETHHLAYRQRYQTTDAGVVVTQGTYCGQTTRDGRLQLILGFIDHEQ